MGRIMSSIQQYQTNNRGRLPPDMTNRIIRGYLTRAGDSISDPDGDQYWIDWGTIGVIPTVRKKDYGDARTVIYRFDNAQCDGSNTKAVDGANRVALSIPLESGGAYCVNN